MNFSQSKDERLLALYENLRRRVELDSRAGDRRRLIGEGVKRYAEQFREKMDRRRSRYSRAARSSRDRATSCWRRIASVRTNNPPMESASLSSLRLARATVQRPQESLLKLPPPNSFISACCSNRNDRVQTSSDLAKSKTNQQNEAKFLRIWNLNFIYRGISARSFRDCRNSARTSFRCSMASFVNSPCLSAFLFSFGAPDPGAPPCIRQRFLPPTTGDLQEPPLRVLAPQRWLANIGPVLR
jgi:hypothetical protein